MNLKIQTDKIEPHFPDLPRSPLLQTLLKNLGFDKDTAVQFLNSHKEEFVDPLDIFGIEKAAVVLEEAIEKKYKVVIHGDFDVDGISATTILFDYLFFYRKIEVLPIIPHRVDEGYGLSEATINKALNWGANMIITVDCGIKDVVLVEKYKDLVDFIITDHHQFYTDENGKIELPPAKAVVHSAHPESKYPCMISGAATAWQLVRAVEIIRNRQDSTDNGENFQLKTKNTATALSSETPPLNNSSINNHNQILKPNEYLDLVAMSTVCDIIPLTLENRKFVQKGCKQVAGSKRMGLHELLKVSGVEPQKVDSYHFGFVLGPRLNAAARVTNDATDALRLLSTKKYEQAVSLAQKLNELNTKRKTLTQEFVEKAEKNIDPTKKAIVVLGHEWPEGILGLIAGKLSEKYHRPTFIASADEGGKITGSSRSPLSSFYLNKALEYAKKHLARFGGHKQAAGFASEVSIFDGFEQSVIEYIEANTTNTDFEKVIDISIALDSLDTITIQDIEELSILEPHGLGNPKPLFLIKNCKIKDYKRLGSEQTHLKLQIEVNGKTYDGIGFGIAESYYDSLHIGDTINVVGQLGINEWNNNKKIQIELKHLIID